MRSRPRASRRGAGRARRASSTSRAPTTTTSGASSSATSTRTPPSAGRCTRSGCARWTASRRRLKPPVLEGPAEADGHPDRLGLHLERDRRSRRPVDAGRHHREPAPLQVPPPVPRAPRRSAILERCERTIVVENNFSGQFARHLRAESGFTADHVLTRYDGEPFEPAYIAERVQGAPRGPARRPQGGRARGARDGLSLRPHPHAGEGAARSPRPVRRNGYAEPVWEVELVNRTDGRPEGQLVIGVDTGSMYGCRQTATSGRPAAASEGRA